MPRVSAAGTMISVHCSEKSAPIERGDEWFSCYVTANRFIETHDTALTGAEKEHVHLL